MSLKYYGIYLAYPPTVDLRREGLGRHLAAFLKGAAEVGGVRFVILCPNWSKSSIQELCENEGVPEDSFDIVFPKGGYSLLTLHAFFQKCRKIKRPKKSSSSFNLSSILLYVENHLNQRLVVSRKFHTLFLNMLILLPLYVIKIMLNIYLRTINKIFSFVFNLIKKSPINFSKKFLPVISILLNPKSNQSVYKKFKIIEEKELNLMQQLIEKMPEIKVWYSPTAFWPSFNNIKSPTLMCVPDVVLTDFPIGFSSVNGDRFLDTFKTVVKTINGGTSFTTYSEYIKNSTLVSNFGINPNYITVIPHAANKLDHLVYFHDHHFHEDSEYLAIRYCRKHLAAALKSANSEYTSLFKNTEIKFFFYASQFRPSKNILTLLKAYKYLLRNRFIGYKLILTGSANIMKEIDDYIHDNKLHKDVLFLNGLSLTQLAACYKLAEIAVNPTSSEGGCPFTFTEALSVNTPVIMSKIPVTTEIITNPELQNMMLFDPYNWRDLAKKLEWALENRQQLLEAQLPVYRSLAKRTWRHVAEDYIKVLDSLAQIPSENQENPIQELCEA